MTFTLIDRPIQISTVKYAAGNLKYKSETVSCNVLNIYKKLSCIML